MLLIRQISADPYQQQTMVLPDGNSVFIQFYFRPMQYGWFINNITFGEFILKGLRITNSPNMLHQWRNKIPFGLACYSVAAREPSQLQDFSSGNSKLYILTEQEVEDYTGFLANGTV